ncbi:MAG: YfcC family protein [Brevinema sp.]
MKKGKMLSSYSIVFIFLVVTAFLTWFVPPSVVVVGEDGSKEIIYNAVLSSSGDVINNAGVQAAGLWDIIMAPVRGFSKSASVAIAILMAGVFLGMINYVGAMDAAIGGLLKKFTGNMLIAVLMFVFALFGTVFGFWEEIPAFAVVIVPLFILAGYDAMTGIAVMMIGGSVGNMASIVNPFSTGAAMGAIGNSELSLGSGIFLRMLIFAVLYTIALVYTLNYSNKVKKNKELSLLKDIEVNSLHHENKTLPELTPRRFWSAMVLVAIIVLLILGYIPWYEIPTANGTMQDVVNAPFQFLASIPVLGTLLGAGNITPLGDWYFDEFAFVFFLGTLIIGLINRIPEEEFVKQFVAGARDLLGVVLVLTVANGISVLMGSKTEGMSVTFVYWIQNILQGIPSWGFVVAAVLAYVGIGFFLQSTSGVAGITMPILGAVAFALFQSSPIGATGGQILLISAFTMGINFMSGIYPGATTMGTLELFNIPYGLYLKFVLKTMLAMLAVGTIIVSLAPFLGLI